MTNEHPTVTAEQNEGATCNRGDESAFLKGMFEYLSKNPKIIFQSQQIDDPDLTSNEKILIARELFYHNPKSFLMRFGPHFDAERLNLFKQLPLSDSDKSEVNYIIEDLYIKLKNRKHDVKNRRYAAMRDMDDYFSETEMMKRDPKLYHEFVGQYLSEEERSQRDAYDVKNTSFSGILLNKMDKDNADEALQQQQLEDDEGEGDHSESTSSDEEAMIETPQSYHQQWGNFDDEDTPCSSSKVVKKQRKSKNRTKRHQFITAEEKEMLRQEFIGMMRTQFLEGKDKEFDYSQVDDNAALDDLKQLNQDKEDEYFRESSDEELINHTMDGNVQSEDDLDVYMEHLNQHPTLRKNNHHI